MNNRQQIVNDTFNTLLNGTHAQTHTHILVCSPWSVWFLSSCECVRASAPSCSSSSWAAWIWVRLMCWASICSLHSAWKKIWSHVQSAGRNCGKTLFTCQTGYDLFVVPFCKKCFRGENEWRDALIIISRFEKQHAKYNTELAGWLRNMISSPRPSALGVRGFTIIVRLRQARPFVLIMHYASAQLHMDGSNSERAPHLWCDGFQGASSF